MGPYHVIALTDQQRVCGNCKYARFDDVAWGACIEGKTPDARGHIYDEDCGQIEGWGICDKHELDIPGEKT